MKKRIGTILVCILLITSSLVIVYPIKALKVSSNTLYVGGNGLGNYTMIQDAIDNASHGDTIFVYNGIYYENVVINKDISLIGEDKNITIVDGGSKNHVIRITYDNVTVSDFTIRNSGGIDRAGIAIYSNYTTITENIITWNDDEGILIATPGSSHYKGCYNLITKNIIRENKRIGITIESGRKGNNTISGNLITYNGYGIQLGVGMYRPAENEIYGNYITYNRWYGIEMVACLRNIIRNNYIKSNGVGIYDTTELMSLNVIKNNNLFDNSVHAEFEFYLFPSYNKWEHNYWGRPKLIPKIIFGDMFYPIGLYDGFYIPWVVFDWHPALIPNYIPPLEVS